MKKSFFLVYIPLLLSLTACISMPEIIKEDVKRPLNTVELKQPNVTFIFPTGEKYRSVTAFMPPKTIDCSSLTLTPDSFENAIEAGASVIRIQTPPKVTFNDGTRENGQPISKTVRIKPVYGGVLALCNVSKNATGPGSRSYRIYNLDKYLSQGKDGLVSVAGSRLKKHSGFMASSEYSWMLWLTDRTATFTDYEYEVTRRKEVQPPAPSEEVK